MRERGLYKKNVSMCMTWGGKYVHDMWGEGGWIPSCNINDQN